MKGRDFAGNPMADLSNWAFPPEMQPNAEELRFDLEAALDSMVLLRSEVPEDAFTAGILGTERVGNGVVIRDDGLVLTIGYLITEASTIWLTSNKGVVVPAFPLAYDQTTGFGLVQPLGKIGVKPLARGTAASCRIGENVVVAGLAPGGPAERAGVRVGDIVMDVAGAKPKSLADLWRRIWRLGPSGTDVSFKLLRKSALMDVRIHSGDRSDFLKKPHLH